jgi:hypothetical protein
MSKRKKRIKIKGLLTCRLCDKESTNLTIQGFCYCITDKSNFLPYERILNGTLVKDLILDKEQLPTLKALYLEKLKALEAISPTREKKKEGTKKKNKKEAITRDVKDKFYFSWEWRKLRFEVLNLFGSRCMLCGATSKTDRICVDHIVPLQQDWGKRLDINNLQVLCDSCNMGKSDTYTTDFRGK